MIEIVDRVPTYPGRVRLTPVSGQANTYDMVRADEPVVEGTPINKALFDVILNDLTSLRKLVNDTVKEITQRALLSNIPDGTEIGLYEHGVLTPFIVVGKNYNRHEGSLVVRKDVYKMDTMLNASDDNYQDSKVDHWLNNEYLTYLDAATQSAIISLYYTIGILGQVTSISRKAVLLSAIEYGYASTIGRAEGSALSYFNSTERRKAYFNGSPVKYYTRTIASASGNNDTEIITAEGTSGIEADPVNTQAGIRPAFTLPLTYEVTVISAP